MPSSRAAVLVVSPSAVYSSRRSEPTLPDITGAGVEADAHLEAFVQALLAQPAVEPVQPVEHVARGRERAVGVVLLLQRRAEHGHDAVAHVGDERAAVVEDRLAHRGQVAVQRRDDLLRLERLGERREAAQVAEHDGRLRARRRGARPRRLEDLVDDGLGHEAGERVARLLALERDGQAVDARRGQRSRAMPASDGVDDRDDRAVVEQRAARRRGTRRARRRRSPSARPVRIRSAASGASSAEHDEQQRVHPPRNRAAAGSRRARSRSRWPGSRGPASRVAGGRGLVKVLQRRARWRRRRRTCRARRRGSNLPLSTSDEAEVRHGAARAGVVDPGAVARRAAGLAVRAARAPPRPGTSRAVDRTARGGCARRRRSS